MTFRNYFGTLHFIFNRNPLLPISLNAFTQCFTHYKYYAVVLCVIHFMWFDFTHSFKLRTYIYSEFMVLRIPYHIYYILFVTLLLSMQRILLLLHHITAEFIVNNLGKAHNASFVWGVSFYLVHTRTLSRNSLLSTQSISSSKR